MVHCTGGKRRSGAFLSFLMSLMLHEPLQAVVDDYCQDAFLCLGDRKCVLRAIGESGLWSLVDVARGDSEMQRILEPILAVISPEVKKSRSPAVEHVVANKRPLPAETVRAAKQQRPSGASSSSDPSLRPPGMPPMMPLEKMPGAPPLMKDSGCLQGQGVQGSSGPTPAVEDHVWRPGDWRCDECGNWNYASRTQRHFKHCRRSYVKPGDWTCPACGNHNSASREFCNAHTCRGPRP